MTDDILTTFTDQEMVDWANANLEKVRELKAEIERLTRQMQRAVDDARLAQAEIAKLQAFVDAAKQMLAEYEAADDFHSSGCMNWTFCEVSTHECGSCRVREALAALEDDDG